MNVHTKTPSLYIFDWTDKDLQLAADMWNEGRSASQIAAVIGVSRNAVMGKVRRAPHLFTRRRKAGTPESQERYAAAKAKITPNRNTGFFERPKREGMTVTAKKEAVKREAEKDALIIEALPEPTSYDAERLAVAKELQDLGRCECRWPVNNGGPFLFCAAETGGKTYCAPHAHRARPKGEVIR